VCSPVIHNCPRGSQCLFEACVSCIVGRAYLRGAQHMRMHLLAAALRIQKERTLVGHAAPTGRYCVACIHSPSPPSVFSQRSRSAVGSLSAVGCTWHPASATRATALVKSRSAQSESVRCGRSTTVKCKPGEQAACDGRRVNSALFADRACTYMSIAHPPAPCALCARWLLSSSKNLWGWERGDDTQPSQS